MDVIEQKWADHQARRDPENPFGLEFIPTFGDAETPGGLALWVISELGGWIAAAEANAGNADDPVGANVLACLKRCRGELRNWQEAYRTANTTYHDVPKWLALQLMERLVSVGNELAHAQYLDPTDGESWAAISEQVREPPQPLPSMPAFELEPMPELTF